MKRYAFSLFKRLQTGARDRFQVWIWGVVLASITLLILVSGLHFRQQQAFRQLSEYVTTMRQARLDLANGFLYITLSGEPGAAYDHEAGLIMLQQAVQSLEQAAGMNNDLNSQNEIADFKKSLAVFRDRLSAYGQNGAGRTGQEVDLRIAYHDLETRVNRVDVLSETNLQNLIQLLDNEYIVALAGAVALLLIICTGTVFSAWAREKSDAALHEREQKLRRLLEILPVGVSILDSERKVVFNNPALRAILKISEEGLAGQSYLKRKYVRPDGSGLDPKDFASAQAARSGQAVSNFETGVQIEGGEMIWTSVSAMPVNFPDWKTVVVTTDITARRSMEERLRQSEERLLVILENSPLSIGITRLCDGKFTYANSAFVSLLGYSREEILGATAEDLGLWVATEDRLGLLEQVESKKHIQNFETVARLKNGEERTVLISAEMLDIESVASLMAQIVDISDLKKAEAQRQEALNDLERERNLMRVMIDNLPDLIFMKDLQSRFLVANQATADVMGAVSPDQLVGRTDFDFYPEDVAARYYANEQQFMQAGQDVLNVENVHFDRDQNVQIMISTKVALHDAQGQVSGLVGIEHDTTEQRRLETKLEERERIYRELVQNANSAILRFNQNGRITFCNEYAQSFFGYTEDEILGSPVDILVSPDEPTRRATAGLAQDILAHPERYQNEIIENVCKDGRRVWMAWTNKPLINERGLLTEILVVGVDITARRITEEALEASRAQMAAALESMTDAVFISDLEGNFTVFNEAFATFHKFKNKTECATTLAEYPDFLEVYLDTGELAPLDMWAVPRALRGETVTNAEYSLRRKDTGERWVGSYSFAPIRDLQGKVVGSVVVGRDITERKAMEENLRHSNAELEQFAYVASHDLQEPLRTVAGMVELLQKRYQGQLDENANEYIHFAVDASERMQKLITDLLEFSRVGRRGRPFEPTDMERVFALALGNLRAAMSESQARITHDPLPNLSADSGQMTQVLQNLIANALKFHSERPLEIHISAERVEGGWRFGVRDNGIGIEPQYFERIFQIFQRLHSRRKYAGTGIGLALCKKIIERHGGKMWVESEFGQGATFYFSLPER